MAKENDRPDRFAHGSVGGEADEPVESETMPGIIGGREIHLQGAGGEGAEDSRASSAEGTIGAVGEMDITGAPAGINAGSAGESEGGGPGGGSMSRGGSPSAPRSSNSGSDND